MGTLGSLDARIGALRAGALAALAVSVLAGATPVAAETRAYALSWFSLAPNSQDGDCSKGLNLTSEEIARRILSEQGKSKAEIEKLMVEFPFNYGSYGPNRGKRDGKAANVYTFPTSVPDPKIRLVDGKYAFGFNLDGKVKPGDFTDPETGETGVDNEFWRVMGCFISMRGTLKLRPTWAEIQWDMVRDLMPAMVIEVDGIDDPKNDDQVDVGFYRALEPIVRSVSGAPQPDMTFRVDPDKRLHNKVRGRIKDGLLTTDTFDFYMIADPFLQPRFDLKQAKLRLTMDADGTVKGIIGGYSSWEDFYVSLATGGTTKESMVSLDLPGIYYAFRNRADGAEVKADTGVRTHISAAYQLEGVSAFLRHPPTGAKTAAAPPAIRAASAQ